MSGRDPATLRRVAVIGAGRAGTSFATALARAGLDIALVHHDDPEAGRPRVSGEDADLVLLCVPDPQIAATAARLEADLPAVVAHCAGSVGLDVLGDHARRGSIHPLVALPDGETGAARLRGAWFALSGDASLVAVVELLAGRTVVVPDDRRMLHHATCVVASNHLVALLGQVERLAAALDVPVEAYLALARGALDSVEELGPERALTGPVARGDLHTVARHLDALPADERDAYRAMSTAAARLAGGEATRRSPGAAS